MVLLCSCRISRVLQYSGYPPSFFRLRLRDYHSVSSVFPDRFGWLLMISAGPLPHRYCYLWFGLFPFRSPLLRKSIIFFLFLGVIRCFSSPGSLPVHYLFMYGYYEFVIVSFLIRISTDHSSFATPRSFSQLVASFFGA